jgi:hypothetical protein
MKPRTLLGLVLLAGAGGLVFWWYQRRGAAASAGLAAPANNLPALEQVGSNYNLDSTPEIVKMTLDFAAKQQARQTCSEYETSDGVHDYFRDGFGKLIKVPAFTYPPNYCGNLP